MLNQAQHEQRNLATSELTICFFHIQPFYRILGIIYNLHIVKNPSQTIVQIYKSLQKRTKTNSLINGIVKKRRSQNLKQPCIEERSDELAGTGAILARAFFYATQQINK